MYRILRRANGRIATLGFALATLSGCADEETPPVKVDTPISLNGQAPMAHGDHSAKRGGFVYMKGDLHYEVILAENGHHRIYLSDATRVELPASILSNVVLEVPHESGLETLKLTIDEFGEAWEARGSPVSDPTTVATLSFRFENQQLSIELPFVPPDDADVMNPHTGEK